ncbi:ribosomal lysine N-methyltransferase 5 [Achaetomium macrosporum]|uniref:Ribosomal lysine N-methyltransferase 5 n=1 Tax=Achaetomium macrosporum TaxID=79813 RepID=A0AAN7CH48_9PEZI|nr:ribosomal lysine N-methyltransferase 5 [Achaetomium macrosporum]
MKLEGALQALGTPVQSAEEETFELFAQDLPSQNLGFVDAKATTLELTVAGQDLTIHQSPAVLSSNRAGGTTGAVVWKITPLFAEWLASPDNPLFTHGVLSSSSLVLELGCGISGLVALLLAPRIARYVLTDQPYVAKLVEQNVSDNLNATSQAPAKTAAVRPHRKAVANSSQDRNGSRDRDRDRGGSGSRAARIRFTPLDWETDEVTPTLAGSDEAKSFDAVVACDCIYNEALIDPFVSTCVDLCRLRANETATRTGTGTGIGAEPCVCVVAQQLRDPLVFEAWTARFTRSFYTWRVPNELLVAGLRSNSGFVVHLGVLKEAINLGAT